jgi:hypothetical protein
LNKRGEINEHNKKQKNKEIAIERDWFVRLCSEFGKRKGKLEKEIEEARTWDRERERERGLVGR